jgi:Tfp pilus assembly protein PilO
MNEALTQLFNQVRRAPFLVFCLTLFLLLSIANYFLWQRQLEITARYEDVRKSGETMFSALSSHSRVVAQLTTVNEALKKIDENLIVETDLAENLGYFYQLETLSRVRLSQLNQLSSQPADDGSPYKAIPFSIRATGSYPQLISFLRELESGPRQLRIKTFDFSRSDAKSNAIALGLTVELLGSP